MRFRWLALLVIAVVRPASGAPFVHDQRETWSRWFPFGECVDIETKLNVQFSYSVNKLPGTDDKQRIRLRVTNRGPTQVRVGFNPEFVSDDGQVERGGNDRGTGALNAGASESRWVWTPFGDDVAVRRFALRDLWIKDNAKRTNRAGGYEGAEGRVHCDDREADVESPWPKPKSKRWTIDSARAYIASALPARYQITSWDGSRITDPDYETGIDTSDPSEFGRYQGGQLCRVPMRDVLAAKVVVKNGVDSNKFTHRLLIPMICHGVHCQCGPAWEGQETTMPVDLPYGIDSESAAKIGEAVKAWAELAARQ